MHRQARTHKGVLCVAGWVLLGPSCAHTMVQLLWDRLLWAAGLQQTGAGAASPMHSPEWGKVLDVMCR